MKTIVKGKPFINGRLEREYNPNFAMDHLVESVDHVNRNGLEGKVTQIELNEILLEMREVTTSEKYEVEVKHDFPFIKMHFEIAGSNEYVPNKGTAGVPLLIPEGHYNFFHIPETDGKLIFDTRRRKTLEIQFTEAFIRRVMGKDMEDTSTDFVSALNDGVPFVMWEKSAPITIELQEYIDQIYNCSFEGNIKKVFLEAKVMELLVVLLDRHKTRSEGKINSSISVKELDIILSVGLFIENHLDEHLTIPDLASIFGTNTTKLKQNFKQVFGTTIFKYMTDVRMKQARSLIKADEFSISEVAHKVGYKNPQHFTAAFKKTYGYLPSSLVRS